MTNTTGLAVRVATPGDAEIVQTPVHEIAAHQNQSEYVTVNAGRLRELLASPQVTVPIVVGHEVLALDDLYVRPRHRDRGIGLLLMNQLSRSAEALTITWGVQPDNDAAIRFYQRLGATTRTKVICAWTPTPPTR